MRACPLAKCVGTVVKGSERSDLDSRPMRTTSVAAHLNAGAQLPVRVWSRDGDPGAQPTAGYEPSIKVAAAECSQTTGAPLTQANGICQLLPGCPGVVGYKRCRQSSQCLLSSAIQQKPGTHAHTQQVCCDSDQPCILVLLARCGQISVQV